MEDIYKKSECCRFYIRSSLYTFYVTAKDHIEALKIIYAFLKKGGYGDDFIRSFDSDYPPYLHGVEVLDEKRDRMLEGNREFLENKYDLSYKTSAVWWEVPEDADLQDHKVFHEWKGWTDFVEKI